jgi:hypothetical protein
MVLGHIKKEILSSLVFISIYIVAVATAPKGTLTPLSLWNPMALLTNANLALKIRFLT